MELEQGLVLYLRNQAAILSLVSSRITPVFLPEGYALPAVVFRRVGANRERSFAPIPRGSTTVLFDLTAWDTDYFQAKTLATVIRVALTGPGGLFGDIPVLDKWYIDGSEEDVIDDIARASNLPYGIQAQYAIQINEGTGGASAPSAGTILSVGDGGIPEVFTPFADVLTISGPGPRRDSIEVSTLDYDEPFEEKLASLIDPSELTFRLFFRPSDALQSPTAGLLAFFLAGHRHAWRLLFPTTPVSTMDFQAAVSGFQVETQVGQPLIARVTLSLTGQIVWSA